MPRLFWQVLSYYLIAVNVLAFVLMGLDKLNFETLPGVWSEPLSFWVVDQDAALELINNGLNPRTADRTLDDLHFVSD